jgi:methylphosphotriester-DNA--protein-cysteine methyltransferase
VEVFNKFQNAPLLRKISDLTDQIGFSHRHFIQVFRDDVGLAPKLSCRIQRFQEVLRRIGNRQQFERVDVALACGYYDQAHFINDFQAFSGLNPTAYLAHPRIAIPTMFPFAIDLSRVDLDKKENFRAKWSTHVD